MPARKQEQVAEHGVLPDEPERPQVSILFDIQIDLSDEVTIVF